MRADLSDVLDTLAQDRYITAEELAKKLNISIKTARNRLKELAEIGNKAGVYIVSRPRYGYLLKIIDERHLLDFKEKLKETDCLPINNEERINYVLMFLLNRTEYIKMEELCDFLCISRSTLQTVLKETEEVLASYLLKINRKPNYGICVVGDEFHIRRCIGECFVKRNYIGLQPEIYSEDDLELIGRHTLNLTTKYHISLNENSFENLVIQIYVAMKRMKHGCYIKDKLGIDPRKHVTEWEIARQLSEILTEWKQVDYSQWEIEYIAVYLAGMRMIGGTETDTRNFIMNEELDQLVMDMLELIYEEYGIELRNDFVIRMTLNQHMVPFHIRMRYKISSKNVILDEVKQNYALAYAMARTCSSILREYYCSEISEDEIGYFAVIFALGLENKNKVIHKYSILIVCSSGRGSSKLLRYKYEHEFGQYLQNIYMCSLHEIASFDMSRIDYVFTTVPIKLKINAPIIEVSQFLRNEDIIKVKGVFEKGHLDLLDDYYKEEQFLVGVPGSNREEIIRNICDKIKQQHQIPPDFYDAIMKREELGQTDFGNKIAMPHPYKVITNETFVYIALLDQPVLWSKNEVQIVFLAAISDKEGDSIQKFYDVTMNLFSDEEMIEDVIKKKDFDHFMRHLREIYYTC